MRKDTFRRGDDAVAVLGAGEAEPAGHTACFADEVVIDFPSVAHAIEKMRHAFVEPDCCTALRARIDLSLRQAAEGVCLPLHVPVRTTCRTCGGRGETWSEPCGRCRSTGTEILNHQVQVSVPPGVADGACFRFRLATRDDLPTRVELHVAVVTRA